MPLHQEKIILFWFRRDLRLYDNAGLAQALKQEHKVLPIFIFDKTILQKLQCKDDARVAFIHASIVAIQKKLHKLNANIWTTYDTPANAIKNLIGKYSITAVYANKDYEPQAIERDKMIADLLHTNNISFHLFKDQVIFETTEILKDNASAYQIYTPYANKWLKKLSPADIEHHEIKEHNFLNISAQLSIPSLNEMGFVASKIFVPPINLDLQILKQYQNTREQIDNNNGTTHISTHLRFGTLSVRELIRKHQSDSEVFVKELIWREFFQMILFHFPANAYQAFQKKHQRVVWENNSRQQAFFEAWCYAQTGYPIIDAGISELNQTGLMHNRVRMIVANFLCKILQVDWRLGEAYFASKLLDFDLASNNGNWQWSAGCGCDAAPYFRIFNPYIQAAKFDPKNNYIKKWLPRLNTPSYPLPIIDFNEGRKRYLEEMKKMLK